MLRMSVKKNLIFNMLYQALNMFMPLITAPYLARVIGAAGTGTYSYYYSIAGYFVLFGMLGVNNYGNRSIAMIRDDLHKLSKTFWEIYSFQLITASISLGVYILWALSVHSEERIIILLNICYVASALFDINWLFFGLEQFKWTSIRNASIKILSVMAILLFVQEREDLYIYIFIMAFSILLSQIVLWPKALKCVKWVRPEWFEIKKHIKSNCILFIPVIAVSLYKMMDKVMLGSLSSRIQSGLYENAEKIINIPIVFVNALGTVMLPKMSNLVARGKKELGQIYIRDSMQFIMGLAIPVTMGTAGIASNFTPVFLGEEFRDSSVVIMVLSVITLFNSWANVIRTQYLIPNQRDREYIISVIAGAIVNIIINSLLITRMGAMGAAIGTVFAEFTVMFIQTIFVCKKLPILKYMQDSWLFIVSGWIMFMLVWRIGRWTGETIIGLAIQVFMGIFSYTIVTWGLFFIFQRPRLQYIYDKIHKK